MTYADFQAHWEQAAGAEYDAYLQQPVADLVADARDGRYGEFYQLWRAIAARATLPLAGEVLLEVLHRDAPYLVRYHAAQALLEMLSTTAFDPVNLSGSRAGQEARLEAVSRLLQERLDGDGAGRA